MLQFQNKQQFTHFASNLNKWIDRAITEHQEEKANCPYLDSLKSKLNYAKQYHPSKVGYYEKLIKEWIEHTPIKANN